MPGRRRPAARRPRARRERRAIAQAPLSTPGSEALIERVSEALTSAARPGTGEASRMSYTNRVPEPLGSNVITPACPRSGLPFVIR
jgi:hypothetical protein